MSKTEMLQHYAAQKTEQAVSSLINAPELIRQIQRMREDLDHLPEAIARQTAQALEPLDRMAAALDQGLDTQRAIMEPLIREAVIQLHQKIDGLAHDRVQRSVAMAREQHRKAMEASRALKGWMGEAKASRARKSEMQEQIRKLTIWAWTATGTAAALFLALIMVVIGKLL